jgi:hypothetical protein
VLALGDGVKSGASPEVLLAQDDAISARTTAAAARNPGLDTLCSYRQEQELPARSSAFGDDRILGQFGSIISAYRKSAGAKAANPVAGNWHPIRPVSERLWSSG